MSSENNDNPQAEHDEIASAFGRSSDPLAEYSDRFERLDVDPFDLYDRENLQARGLAKSTYENHKRAIRQWKSWMEQYDRHPACPNVQHVKDFALYRIEEDGCQRSYVKDQLFKLGGAYGYFQDEAAFPMTNDYNPFRSAMAKLDLTKEEPKEPHPMSLPDVRRKVEEITHVRDRAMVGGQFKWGLRASEECNIKLSEIHITNSDLLDHYEEMGTHPALEGRENALYIPHDRENNKSERPRVIPIDDEMRKMLLNYLLVRPDVDEPWLFLSKKGHKKVHPDNLNEIWVKHFRPEFGANDRFRGVSSHYGRHFFTTWFNNQTQAERSLVKYLRGDKQSGGQIRSTREAIDSYIHVYYGDIESLYRSGIFKFNF